MDWTDLLKKEWNKITSLFRVTNHPVTNTNLTEICVKVLSSFWVRREQKLCNSHPVPHCWCHTLLFAMNHCIKYITTHMTTVRLQGRIGILLFIHHTSWHTKWKLFFEVSHTIKMTHCYAAHFGFLLLFLTPPPQLTTNWKQKSHGLKNVSVSGVSKQPCLLVKASDLLLVSG